MKEEKERREQGAGGEAREEGDEGGANDNSTVLAHQTFYFGRACLKAGANGGVCLKGRKQSKQRLERLVAAHTKRQYQTAHSSIPHCSTRQRARQYTTPCSSVGNRQYQTLQQDRPA
eukprot:3554604-Rhodomonas_salina.2